MSELLNVAALLQSIILLILGSVAGFYGTRYWRQLDARKKAQDEAAVALKARNAAADTERQALLDDMGLNRASRISLLALQEQVRTLALAANTNEARNEAMKETLARIDGQLSSLINTFLHRA